MSDDVTSGVIEQVTRWKVRCYDCGWLPTKGTKEKAEREKRQHERECETAEVKRVSATLHPEEIWSDTTAADLLGDRLLRAGTERSGDE